MMESPAAFDDSDSEFELAGLGDDDDDDVGMDTSVLLFEDDDDDADTTSGAVVAAGAGVAAVAAGAAALRESSVDSSADFEDFDDDDEFDMEDDDDFDDDVFDAADDDFDDDFDAGESQAEFAGAGPVVSRAAVEHDWGVGWLVALSIGSILMIMCCMLSFDLVRSMWAWKEPTPISNILLDTLGGLFTS
jgi:hypothetical protein